MEHADSDVLIIGGGLAGLFNAIHLSKAGLKVTLLEKNDFPKHKVCGEYISNEVLPYLQYLGIDLFALGATKIDKMALSAYTGKTIKGRLPIGGFGISRYTLDYFLYQKALDQGCQIIQTTVSKLDWQVNQFQVFTQQGAVYQAPILIGAYGKRSNLDVSLSRPFIQKKAPYLAVKNHYIGDFPEDLVALHNFRGGYCGVSKVENERINICYLADYASFKRYKNLDIFQQEVLYRNPHLKFIFENYEPIFPKPLTISQVSFSSKQTVEEHLLMSGDSAGMIHPLCGNGMAMAIDSAKILSELLIRFFEDKTFSRQDLEKAYAQQWRKEFQGRLLVGKFFQTLFNRDVVFEKLIAGLTYVPALLPVIVRQTHGNPVKVNT